MQAIIGDTTYDIKTNTFSAEDEIEQRATCSFSVVDKNNEYTFQRSQPVTVIDENNNDKQIFAGFLETVDKYPLVHIDSYMHDIVCVDMHYLADKRRISYAARDKLAGGIIKDIVDQKLVEEGVYYSKDLNFVETTTADFETGELSNTIAENDSLKLDKTGTDITDTDNDNASFSEGTLTDVVATSDGLELDTYQDACEENNDISGFTVGTQIGSHSVVSSPVTQGNYARKIVTSGTAATYDELYYDFGSEISPHSTVWYLKIPNLGTGNWVHKIKIFNSNENEIFRMGFDIGDVKSAIEIYDQSISNWGKVVINPYPDNTWFKVEIIWDWINETYDIYVDDNLKISNEPFEDSASGYCHWREFWDYDNGGITGYVDGLQPPYGYPYKSQGNRRSPQLDLSTVGTVESSQISWQKDFNDNTYYFLSGGFSDSDTAILQMNGIDRAVSSRGMNTILINNGSFIEAKAFDTCASTTESDALASYINGLNAGDYLAIAVEDEAEDSLTQNAINAITNRLSSTRISDLTYRESWLIFSELDGEKFTEKWSGDEGQGDAVWVYNITIETSTDGGSTWDSVTNGGSIPNIAGASTLDVRQTLETNDTAVTPVLESLTVELNSAYKTTGYRISEPFDLSPAVEDGGSTISWQETTPTNTSITVETSLDDGATWDTATNGQPIPNLPTDLFNIELKYKTTLNTVDTSVTPTFDEVNIDVLPGKKSIEDGTEILETRANFVSTEQLISSVADKMNYWWKIDSNKMIHFKSRESEPADWQLEPQYIRGLPTTKTGNPLYRNQQLVRGPVGITETQTDVSVGDGESRAFPVSFPIAKEPTIEVSIDGGAYTTQTVGIKGQDTSQQWYWEPESDIITQDTSGTRLTANDKVKITFIGQFKIIAQTYDPQKITQQKTIDGTSGIVEDAINVGNVEGREAAIEIGNSKIKKYGVDSKQLKFQTRRSGLQAGQLITVNGLTSMDIDEGEKLLITRTNTFDENGQISYDISAVKGPKHRTWEEFFMELSKRVELVVREGIGESEILIIPINFSKTWTFAENPNIFRQLKADGTWQADGTYTPNFEASDRVKYIAWFNGTTELGRQEITQQDINTDDRVNTLTYLGPNSANEDITHFGWIGGFRATETAGTGVLIDKQAYDIIKEQTEALQITKDDYSWNY